MLGLYEAVCVCSHAQDEHLPRCERLLVCPNFWLEIKFCPMCGAPVEKTGQEDPEEVATEVKAV